MMVRMVATPREVRAMATKKGQALIELVLGLLALTIVVIALTESAAKIVKSLKEQNSYRTSSIRA